VTTAEAPARDGPELEATPPAAVEAARNGPVLDVDPDLGLIRAIGAQAGTSYKRCVQCGTCSGTCALAPNDEPFPRREMAWAVWGLGERLVGDPNAWLCFQCNDCSVACPRGARPGDVMAAIRTQCIVHHATPRFLARWVDHPAYIPLLLAIPAGLLSLALFLRDPLAGWLGLAQGTDGKIVYSYSRMLPHWLLNSFFVLFLALAVVAMVGGVVRFWRSMQAADAARGGRTPVRSVAQSIWPALRRVFLHEDFGTCEKGHSRFLSHLLVVSGFLALTFVGFWVLAARSNPLVAGDFAYPFGFWSPWKMLANVGGIAVLAGLLLMTVARWRTPERAGNASYSDWFLISTLSLVILSGFAAEVLHYIRLEPPRHATYFFHLVFVFVLLVYLPYSRLAHAVYRTVALVYAEHTGRTAPHRKGEAQ